MFLVKKYLYILLIRSYKGVLIIDNLVDTVSILFLTDFFISVNINKFVVFYIFHMLDYKRYFKGDCLLQG
jgi:hypothetical protein